ncbi:MAG: RdgB/HAM1 family non-canonical purine NTP pyrophosphatase [Candidatus Omnitrophica bacterium]|nr:RdgB/HAM1 family non-canonical purine NTP pyrophosphatase [Candidatus Omnitrophota bacterium]
MNTLVLATLNHKKAKELRDLLGKVPFRVRAWSDFNGVRKVREGGRTYRENAVKKARAAAKATGFWTLADDSGLEVEALGGRPGVRTARFARKRKGITQDESNNRKLLKVLRGARAARRAARFRCVIAVVSPQGMLFVSEGVLKGRIAEAPRGRSGFGYDPVFLVPGYGKTVAQLGKQVKRRISHRAKAVRKARRWLMRTIT